MSSCALFNLIACIVIVMACIAIHRVEIHPLGRTIVTAMSPVDFLKNDFRPAL